MHQHVTDVCLISAYYFSSLPYSDDSLLAKTLQHTTALREEDEGKLIDVLETRYLKNAQSFSSIKLDHEAINNFVPTANVPYQKFPQFHMSITI